MFLLVVGAVRRLEDCRTWFSLSNEVSSFKTTDGKCHGGCCSSSSRMTRPPSSSSAEEDLRRCASGFDTGMVTLCLVVGQRVTGDLSSHLSPLTSHLSLSFFSVAARPSC